MITPSLMPPPNALAAHSSMLHGKFQPRCNVVMMAHGQKAKKMGYNQLNKSKMHHKKDIKWQQDMMPKDGDSFNFDASKLAQS